MNKVETSKHFSLNWSLMQDIEALTTSNTQTVEDSMSTSLRKRTNARSTVKGSIDDPTSHSNMLSNHQNLVMRINRANNDGKDDELKKKVRDEHMESNKQIAKAQSKLLLFLAGMIAITYIYISLGDEAPSNQSSLSKALRILLGISKRSQARLPAQARVVAYTSISKERFEKYSYPSWPWSSYSKHNFLVPTIGEGKRIQDILHKTTKLKAERGMSVELYSPNEIRSYLKGTHGQHCSNINNDTNISILEQYDAFGKFDMKEAQKLLWLWCAIYSGEVYGFVDLDSFEFHLSHKFINDLSRGKIKNTIIEAGSITNERVDVDTQNSLATSIVFIPNRDSDVAKSMLDFFLTTDADIMAHDMISNSIIHLNTIVEAESAKKWTLLQANCDKNAGRWPLATVCQREVCCELTLRQPKHA